MYEIYYHIPSKLNFRSNKRSLKVVTIDKVLNLMPKLKWKNDVIFIYHLKTKLKISISLNSSLEFVFEIISPDGVFFRNVTKNEIYKLLAEFDEIVDNSDFFNFISESI